MGSRGRILGRVAGQTGLAVTGAKGVKTASNDSDGLGTGDAGDLKFATNRKTLHLYDGNEWDRIAGGTDADPVIVTDATNAAVSGTTDSARQTFKVVDPEGFPISYSITYMRDSDKKFFTNDSSNLPPPLAHPAIITKAIDGTATYRFLNRTAESDGSGNSTKDLYKARYMGSDGARHAVSTKNFQLSFGAYTMTDFVFQTAQTSGPRGPNLARALAFYDTSTHSWLNDTNYYNILTGFAQGVQLWKPPADGNYTIEMAGAQGGRSNYRYAEGYNYPTSPGGFGAKVTATLTLSGSAFYAIGVGQLPQNRQASYLDIGVGTGSGVPDGGWSWYTNPAYDASGTLDTTPYPAEAHGETYYHADVGMFHGGGGASWIGVYDGTSTGADNDIISTIPLLVAGGGGSIRGGTADATLPASLTAAHAALTGDANQGKNGTFNSNNTGGSNGNGSPNGPGSRSGSGGAGWLSDHSGTIDTANQRYENGYAAQALRTGGQGASMTQFDYSYGYPGGGFGGGGHGGYGGSGGGGGYSGGGSGGNTPEPYNRGGGGGSSFITSNSTYNPTLVSESATHGHEGYVKVTKL